jgi:ubiquinol-cytochrome c reductase cytochrome b subunit
MDSPVKNKSRLLQWVEKRWPLSPVIRWGSVEEIPGGTKFAYVLGSATLVLFVVLVMTGVWQLLYYVPTVDHAYDSVMFLRLQVPLGWLIHGLHYWAAQAFIVVMGLHMARVFIWAAYKKPRELTWVLGVVLLLLGAAFVFTGAILPWDTLGYWAGEVGTDMAGTFPLVGNFLKLLMRGGASMGQMTLSRAFAVHVAILPALTMFFIAAHLVAFRQFGSVGPWKPKKQEKTGSFWPDQTFKDLLVFGLILVVLVCLSAFVRAPITGPADPLDNSYSPKPEWNFLFLYEALKAFKGSWEWVGTVVIPALLVLLLFAVPFIDRNEKRNPFRRPIAMLGGFMFVTVILVLTFVGYYSNPGAGATASVAAAPAATNHVSTPEASSTSPEKTKTDPSLSTNAPVSSSATPAPTHQVAPPEASSYSPAKPQESWRKSLFESLEAVATSTTLVAQSGQGASEAPEREQNAVPPPQTNAAADNASGSTNDGPTYLGAVQPIFAASCARCHSPQSKIYDWLDYKAAHAHRREIERRVWDSWKGWYYKEAMPPPNSPESRAFTEAERRTIRNWVNGEGGAVLGVAPAPTPPAPASTNQVAGSASSAASPAKPESGQPSATAPAEDVQEGRGLFASVGCMACHKIEGKGGVAGPDLSHEASLGHSSQWLMTQITNPRKHDPSTIMPAHKSLTQAQLKSLADFILNPSPGKAPVAAQPIAATPPVSTNAPAAATAATEPTNQVAATATATASPEKPKTAPQSTTSPATASAAPAPTNQVAATATSATSPAKPAAGQTNAAASTGNSQEGRNLFASAGCATCHTIEGEGGKTGPDLSHEAKSGHSSQWLMTQIADPHKHDPSTIMPAHKSLTQPQLKALADFILNPSSSPTATAGNTASNAEKQPPASSSTPAPETKSTDAEAPPVTVVQMIGDSKHGAVLFGLDCAKCHGKDGEGHVPNPGSQAGVVTPLAPIPRALFNEDPVLFAANIDLFIQHGATPPGPSPALRMPAFGATHSLTVPEIANIEAYVLSLNGVDAAKIVHPGIAPVRFVEGTVALFVLALLAIGGLCIRSRASSRVLSGGHPTPEEFQALRLEVIDLKHKLEEMEINNPKDHSPKDHSERIGSPGKQ